MPEDNDLMDVVFVSNDCFDSIRLLVNLIIANTGSNGMTCTKLWYNSIGTEVCKQNCYMPLLIRLQSSLP